MLKLSLFLLLIFAGASARAGDPIKETIQGYNDSVVQSESETTDWNDGIHLIAGAGLNFATFQSDMKNDSLGVGSNLRSDIGYYFENGLGLELSASVMFNRVPLGLIWTSGFMIGVRFAVPPILPLEDIVPYVRLFAGRSLNIVDFNGTPPPQYDESVNRIQIQGTLLGFGLGHFQRSESGRVWYAELTVERHSHETIDSISQNAGVPTVIHSDSDTEHGVLYAFCLTIGAVLF